MSRFQKAFRNLGLPQALGWANVFVIFVLQISGSAISSLIDYSQRPIEFFTIRVLALCVFALVILLGRIALNMFAIDNPLPLVTLLTFVVALAASTMLFDLLVVAAGFTDQHVFLRRITTSSLGVMTSQVLTSLLVTYLWEFSRNNALLAQAQSELLSTRAEATSRISERKTQLISRIREEITQQLNELGSDVKKNLQHMQSLIDDVVRPISYSLIYDVQNDSDVELEKPIEKLEWKTILSGSLYGNPFYWVATPLLLGAIAATFLITSFQLRGLLASLSLLCVSGLMTLIGEKLWKFLPFSTGVTARVVIFTTYNLGMSWLSLLVMSSITKGDLIDSFTLPAWLIMSTLAVWTVSLVKQVSTMLQETNANLTLSISELKREVVALNSSYRQLQREISRVLHGPVQQAIHAALARLKTKSDIASAEFVMQDLQTRISSALDLISAPNVEGENLTLVIHNLQTLWQDSVQISFEIEQGAEEALNSHPSLSLSVSELIQEATSNAIRHGEAKNVQINIGLTQDKRNLEFTVTNDGIPLVDDAQAGLGSQLFDELTINWSRAQVDQSVVISAVLPAN